jgi:hypothetical protein
MKLTQEQKIRYEIVQRYKGYYAAQEYLKEIMEKKWKGK